MNDEQQDEQKDMTDLRELLEDTDTATTTRRRRKELTELRPVIDKQAKNRNGSTHPEHTQQRSSTSDEGVMDRINQARQHEMTPVSSMLGYILLFSAFLQMFVVPNNMTGFVIICLTAIAGFASLGLPFLFHNPSD